MPNITSDYGESSSKSGWLWIPYVILTLLMLCLLAASFINYHFKNRGKYRRDVRNYQTYTAHRASDVQLCTFRIETRESRTQASNTSRTKVGQYRSFSGSALHNSSAGSAKPKNPLRSCSLDVVPTSHSEDFSHSVKKGPPRNFQTENGEKPSRYRSRSIDVPVSPATEAPNHVPGVPSPKKLPPVGAQKETPSKLQPSNSEESLSSNNPDLLAKGSPATSFTDDNSRNSKQTTATPETEVDTRHNVQFFL